jgi:hypothetical protein
MTANDEEERAKVQHDQLRRKTHEFQHFQELAME